MKFNTLFVSTLCASTLLSSCVFKTAEENQLKYTHTSLVDGDAFAIIQKVGEAALTGVEHAKGTEGSPDAKSKEVANKVKAYYEQLLPGLDSIATRFHVDFPIKGIPAVDGHVTESDTAHTSATADSLHSAHAVAHVEADHNHEAHHGDYTGHAQHELALVKEQLTRLSRNTNKELQDFAKQQLPLVSELYRQIGGKEEAHGHH